MADQTYSDFLSSFAKKTEGQKREDSEESYEDALKQWELDKKTIEDFKREGIALPEGFEEKVDQMEEILKARAPAHEEKKPRDLSTYMMQDQKMSAREKDPWWKRARRTESARSLLGPEVGFVGEYKPAGSYIDKHGVIGAAFRPTPMVDWVPTFKEGEDDGAVKGGGKGAVNAVVNVVKSLGSLGGMATMGGMSALKGAAEVGKATGTVTGWGRARDAEAALKAGHKLFALDLTRNVLEHNPEVRRIMYDPDASVQEKTESIAGQALLMLFAKGAIKGGFKKEMSKAKTPKEAVEAYNKWADIQRKNQAREIEGKKTDKHMLEQEAREIEMTKKTEKPMLEQEARELELARRAEEAKKFETTIPEQEIIEMARAERAAKLIEPVKEVEKPALEAEPEAGSEAAYYKKPTDPVVESLKEEAVPAVDVLPRAEPDVRADPVVESLKGEKVEEVARGEAEITEAKEAKVVEAAEGTLVPQTDRVRRFHKITKRHLEMVKDDPSEVASWIENPDSAYDAMPTSRVAKVIETFKIPEIDEQLQKLSDGELSVERALLEQRRIDLLRQRYLKEKTTENEAAYKDAVQDSANESTFLGQLIQARAFFKASDPTVTADLIEAAIKKNKGPKLTKAERKTLVERVVKAQKAQEIADKTANAFHESRTDANWESAVKALRDAEAAKIEQLDFIMDKNPKEFADLVVSFLQGNYLTPTTIAVNVFGNIAPLPARAGARTFARGIDVIDQYFMRPRRESERARLVSEQEVNPTAKNAARLEKLERMLSPMEQMRLSPKKGSWEKIKGLVDATGIKRLYKAAKEAKKGGITLK